MWGEISINNPSSYFQTSELLDFFFLCKIFYLREQANKWQGGAEGERIFSRHCSRGVCELDPKTLRSQPEPKSPTLNRMHAPLTDPAGRPRICSFLTLPVPTAAASEWVPGRGWGSSKVQLESGRLRESLVRTQKEESGESPSS